MTDFGLDDRIVFEEERLAALTWHGMTERENTMSEKIHDMTVKQIGSDTWEMVFVGDTQDSRHTMTRRDLETVADVIREALESGWASSLLI